MTIEDHDMGYARILRELGDLGDPGVEVGILEREGAGAKGEATLAEVAMWNEFGTSDGHVPERSFLRSTVDENKVVYGRELQQAIEALVDRGGDAQVRFERLGLRAVRDVQRKIRQLRTPPNAPRTVAKKGSSNPLIDTGQLRQSIRHRIVEGGE